MIECREKNSHKGLCRNLLNSLRARPSLVPAVFLTAWVMAFTDHRMALEIVSYNCWELWRPSFA
jgi:hypothetical protein